MNKKRTFAELMADGTKKLKDAQVDSPAKDVRLLLQAASQCDAASLIANAEQTVSDSVTKKFDRFIKERITKKPTHRIIGQKNFFGVSIEFLDDTFEPRPETECLVDSILETLSEQKKSDNVMFVDLGSGSGAIAIALLHQLPNSNAIATDVSSHAIKTIKKNTEKFGLNKRLEVRQGNWTDALPKNTKNLDFVVCNPPYIKQEDIQNLSAEVRMYDPEIALNGGEDGLNAYKILLQDTKPFIGDQGFIALETGFDQKDEVTKIAKKLNWKIIKTKKDLQGLNRVVIAKKMPQC